MGMYPAQPGAQSGLRVACRFDTSAGESVAPLAFTVHDFDVAKFLERLNTVHPGVECLQVSATTGEGMEAWREWLARLPGRRMIEA